MHEIYGKSKPIVGVFEPDNPECSMRGVWFLNPPHAATVSKQSKMGEDKETQEKRECDGLKRVLVVQHPLRSLSPANPSLTAHCAVNEKIHPLACTVGNRDLATLRFMLAAAKAVRTCPLKPRVSHDSP